MQTMNEVREIAIILPFYNEQEVVEEFLELLVQSLSTEYKYQIIAVNDGSLDNTLQALQKFKGQNSSTQIGICILDLPFNLGHQHAILQGLYKAVDLDSERIVVMDSDGEDDPTVINKLIQESSYDLVQVRRGKRSEGFRFRFLYQIYNLFFLVMLGRRMNVGNFSCFSRKVAHMAIHKGFVHLGAFLDKQRLNKTSLVVNRTRRISGRSKMSINALIYHAMYAVLEFAEELLMVFFRAFLLSLAVIGVMGWYILYIRLFTEYAIAGWTSTVLIGLITIAVILIGFFVQGLFLLRIYRKRTFPKLYENELSK